MKKEIIRIVGGLSLALILILIIRFAISVVPLAGSSGNIPDIIRMHLIQYNIPVKSVRMLNASPLDVEVILQIPPGRAPYEYLWEKFLAMRELNSADQSMGIPLKKYHFLIVTADNKKIYDMTADFEHTQPTKKITPVPALKVDLADTKNLTLKDLNLQEMNLTSLDVKYGNFLPADNKQLWLELSTGTSDGAIASQRINAFIPKLDLHIRNLNERSGTQISIIRLRITDPDGALLVYFIEDLDNRVESSWEADNIEANWLPRPVPLVTKTPSSPQTTTAYPSPDLNTSEKSSPLLQGATPYP